MCEKWNFPKAISKAIEYHHYPHRSGINKLACLINTADKISKWNGEVTESLSGEIDKTTKAMLGLKDDEFKLIMNEMKLSVNQITNETGMTE
jgi:HD superfamily phosphohydrolase YqeK